MPLHDVVFPKPSFEPGAKDAHAARLTRTEWAQPAIGAASLATLRLLEQTGLTPRAVAGHSFGEVVALHAAGAIDEADVLRIARARGERMAEAAERTAGAMTAVSADASAVHELIESASLDVVIANHNAPDQVVISGTTQAIETAEAALQARSLRFKRLDVATAFHSPVVSAAAAPFAGWLEEISVGAPSIPVYANASAAPYPSGAAELRSTLGGQLAQPVRFVETIEAMYAAGVRTFVEVGPSPVLTGLVAKILGERPHLAVATDRKGGDALAALHHALGKLAAAGHPLALGPLFAAYEPLEDPRASKKPRMTLKINGSNYGKPYPPAGGAAALPQPNPEKVEEPPRVEIREVVVEKPVYVREDVTGPSENSVMSRHDDRPSMSESAQLAWIQAYQETQKQTAEAHGAFQRSMADAHAAFLRSVESSFVALASSPLLQGGAVASSSPALGLPQPAPRALATEHAQPATTQTAYPAPAQPAATQPVATGPAHTGWAEPPATSAPVSAAAPAPEPAPVEAAPVEAAPGVDLLELMLDVVAQKTGYPAEMIGREMELEADLGIDSIKRVEILAAVRERAPGLPELDPAQLGALRTVGEIVDYLQAALPEGATSTPSAAPTAAQAPTPPASAPAADLMPLMLEVVAEKTGYPVEMIGHDMELEADLGIDSIKRVEILAAVRERAPGLPELDPAQLGALRTVGEIVEHLRAHLPAGEASSAQPATQAPAAATDAPTEDLLPLMLEVVAQKTGYPAEMIGRDMELEADLGIDSIKRVEILAAVRERVPSLPELDPAQLGALRTVGEIVDHLAQTSGTPAAGAKSAAPAPAAPAPAAERWVTRAEPAAPIGMIAPGLLGASRLVVTDDESGVATALVDALATHGLKAEVVREVPDDADAVIVLAGLRRAEDVDAQLAAEREAFHAARAVAERLSNEPGAFVTVQDTGGDFGLSGSPRAWLGGIAALTKTCAQEWPKASVRAIDLARGERSPEELAEILAEELVRGGPELEVGLRADGSRLTLISERAPIGASAPILEPGDVVVASGGARGVTATTLIALADATKCRLVLLGRTALTDEPAAARGAEGDAGLKRALLEDAKARGEAIAPAELGKRVSRILANREIRATIDAVRAAGGDARYVAVDVQDAEAVARALDEARASWGPIRGLVHGAGVLADRFVADKTDAQFDLVFDTKVQGLRALLEATADDPLKVMVMFSSVAARCGNQGQCDYAMANEVLNLVAAAEAQKRGIRVRSLGWGPWEGGMVTPALKARFESLGVPLIALEDGARMLVEELGRDAGDDVMLVLGGEPRAEALATEPARTASKRLEVLVSHRSHPFVASHVVKGAPVLPAVMVLELFARAARARRPDSEGERHPRSLRAPRRAPRALRGRRRPLRGRERAGGQRLERDLRDDAPR